MKPNWTIQNEILKRTKREADYQWAISNTSIELPKYQPTKVEKGRAGWYNFFRGNINQLRP